MSRNELAFLRRPSQHRWLVLGALPILLIGFGMARFAALHRS